MGGGFYENEVDLVTYPSPPKIVKPKDTDTAPTEIEPQQETVQKEE